MSTKIRKQKEKALLKTKDEDVTIVDQAPPNKVSKKRANAGKCQTFNFVLISCFLI